MICSQVLEQAPAWDGQWLSDDDTMGRWTWGHLSQSGFSSKANPDNDQGSALEGWMEANHEQGYLPETGLAPGWSAAARRSVECFDVGQLRYFTR
jgi:hypothetical protein